MKKQFIKIVSLFSVFVLLCCPVLHSFANALSATAEVVSAKVDPEVMAAFADGVETVEVYVWLNDIDQKQVDAIVEQKTGLRADNLAVIDENISDELANEIMIDSSAYNLADSTQTDLQAYFDRTGKQRAIEKQRTDEFITVRRAQSKQEYNIKSNRFLKQTDVDEEKIIFKSNYTPMLILELTEIEVKEIARRNDVVDISIVEPCDTKVEIESNLTEMLSVYEIDTLQVSCGLTGDDVKIGMLENCSATETTFYPFNNDIVSVGTELTNDIDNTLHARFVAYIMAGDEGIANNATIYTFAADAIARDESTLNYALLQIVTGVEALLDCGVSLINMSAGTSAASYYDSICRWVDAIVATQNVTFVVSAGNDGDEVETLITSPGLAYNAITVGAYDCNLTSTKDDDAMLVDSSYYNGYGCEKPDIIAPSNSGLVGKTSGAAAFVSGCLALLLELRPSLLVYPQAVKAICLASCHNKVNPATITDEIELLTQGITDIQGAGAFNPFIAIAIASQGTYGIRELSGNTIIDIPIYQPTYGASGINTSIAWLKENTFTDSGEVSEGSRPSLHLYLRQNGTNLSSAWDDFCSTGMVYYPLDNGTTDNLILRIRRQSSGTDLIRCGYAWSIDTARFQYTQPFEGFYYLKNAASGYYLSADSATLNVSQKAFSGETSQIWIIQKDLENPAYHIKSAYESIGSLWADLSNTALVSGVNAKNISIIQHSDGSFSFTYTDANDTIYILGITDNSTNENSIAQWSVIDDDIDETQKWFFETLGYHRGDINMDGTITYEESTYILRVAAGSENPTATAEIFLCDVNGSGTITSADARLADRYSSGMMPNYIADSSEIM